MNTSNSIQPGSMKTISDNKLVAFAIGKQTKSRFQKAREEKEQKKKQDESEAALVYDDFVASFTNDDDGNKVFIRGGKINNGGSALDTSDSGDVYRMVSKASNEVKNVIYVRTLFVIDIMLRVLTVYICNSISSE